MWDDDESIIPDRLRMRSGTTVILDISVRFVTIVAFAIPLTGLRPKVVVQCLARLLRILPSWSLDRRPAVLAGFSWLFSVSTGKCRESPLKLGHDRVLPHPFQVISQLSPFLWTLYNLS
jgi:hypothetical protein